MTTAIDPTSVEGGRTVSAPDLAQAFDEWQTATVEADAAIEALNVATEAEAQASAALDAACNRFRAQLVSMLVREGIQPDVAQQIANDIDIWVLSTDGATSVKAEQ
jgi:hypothetical protein